MALVGPTGAGKTTSLAKLAARYAVHERARVALITTDTYRVGAAEQLGVYANIVGLPLEVADEPGQIRSALRRFARHDLVLLDTTGCSHFNLRQLKELKELLDAAEPDDVALVLSASTQLQELRTALANFKCAEPNQLLFTKLDETRRYGALLTLACEEGFPLGYFGVGQDVPDDLVQVKPGMLGDLVLRRRINGG
jgi:flagellar biosynthesis protein FlhF